MTKLRRIWREWVTFRGNASIWKYKAALIMARGQDSGNLRFTKKKKEQRVFCTYALDHNLRMFSPVPRKDTKKRKHFPTLLSRRVFPKYNKSMAYGWASAWISMGLGHNLNTYGTDQWCHSRAYCWHHTTMKAAEKSNPSPHWGPSLYSSHCNLTKPKKETSCCFESPLAFSSM